MPLDSGTNNRYAEIGVSGLTQYSGYVHEEILTELQNTKWRKVLKQMLANDSTVNSLNFCLEMMIRQVGWKITSADESRKAKKLQEFYHGALFEDLGQTWQDLLGEIVSFISWGWAIHEIVYKRRTENTSKFTDGKVGWKRFGGRAQDTLDHWLFDEEDYATAMVQRNENYGEIYTIPLSKCLHFRTSTVKNNPEGKSIYRGAYRAWYFKSRIENIEAIGTERDLAGLPCMYVPDNLLRTTASTEEKALLALLKQTVQSIRRDENEGVLIPSLFDTKGNRLFELTLLSTGGSRQFDTDKMINRYKVEILSVAMADFMMLGSQSKTGSYSLSTDKTEMFCIALEAFLDIIAQQFNNKAFPDLADFNGFERALLPRLEHEQVDKMQVKEIFEALGVMSGASFTFTEEEQNWFKEQIQLPVTTKTV